MKRIKLVVAYDGTDYCGWQIQPGVPTIEGVLNETLSRVLKEEIRVTGASRTDAGVHAYGNVAVFDTETPIPPEKISFAVNPHLPEDVRLVRSEQVADDFHPRYCDTKKTYEYHIQTGPMLYPTKGRYCHWLPKPLDVEAMRQAGSYLIGTHDFKSFCAANAQVKTTVRKVCAIEVEQEIIMPGIREVIIRVEGEGFLYNMVRIISGTLIRVGLHVWQPEYVKTILEAKDRTQAGETVPAKGLFLKEIVYL